MSTLQCHSIKTIVQSHTTSFSSGVIEIDSNGQAQVKDARYDSCSRNV